MYEGPERRKLIGEDHDLLIRIETKLDRALFDVDTLNSRVKVLENGYWKVVGAVGGIVLVGDAVMKWMFK